ncbi:proton-coupled zinc antiporter SLC30A2-like [Ylistrum balloti]|uniref:proton-coupled zinc antiporter SLC30A2-like n=1 Tax=Ylistrum balloti TaxID=509963 RepID=UPI002905E960|nr:proton-coupled zinc antiporter SLC30A2-like [Ylistrum balloti]
MADSGAEDAPLLVPRVEVVTPNPGQRSGRPRSRCSLSLTDSDVQNYIDGGHDDSSERSGKYSGGAHQGKGHCHANKTRAGLDKTARRKLLIASVLCLCFMTGEFVGGILAHSLAIISDAAHMLTDLASFLISLFALFLASRPATKKLSFGWYRAEILGALMSIVMLWVLTGILVYMGVVRITSGDFELNPVIMLITASLGVCINILMGLTLHQNGHTHGGGAGGGHSHSSSNAESLINSSIEDRISQYGSVSDVEQNDKEKPLKHSSNNINVKAAFVHVLGDLLQSIGVLVAAIMIYIKPEWKIADPICTFIFSVLVLMTTFTVVRDLLRILMEGTPRGIDIRDLQSSLYRLPGVKDIHDLRVWSLSMDKLALSVHLAVSVDHNPLDVLKEATQMIQLNFGIQETTIQTEAYEEEMLNCTQCQDLPD